MRKIGGLKNKAGRKFKYDISFMRAVVREYETSDFSTAQVAQKYGIAANQVTRWKQKFSTELSGENLILTDIIMNPDEQREFDAMKKQNEEIAKRLELANLQITGLEMLIDVAEDELQIDIRKKSGTKQSNE